MRSAHVFARRPLIAAVVGVLLVSACSSAAESTPSPTTPPTDSAVDPAPDTTRIEPAAPPTTTPPTTVPPAAPTPIDGVDVSGQTVFGLSLYEAVDVDAVAADVSARLGPPTNDIGWQPVVGESCAGAAEYRVLWWGDFRMTFERYQIDGANSDELSTWTIGDPTVSSLAPIGDVPELSPSNIVTLEGIGLGSTRVEVDAAWANVNNGGGNRLVVIDRGGALSILLDAAEQVVGFGMGPFDCPVDEQR